MGKKKTEKIVDFGRAKRIKTAVQKIKEIYKDNDDGLNRLADKLREIPDDAKPKLKKHVSESPTIKCTGLSSGGAVSGGGACHPRARGDKNRKRK